MAGFYKTDLGSIARLMEGAKIENPFAGVATSFSNIANMGRQLEADERAKQEAEFQQGQQARLIQKQAQEDILSKYGTQLGTDKLPQTSLNQQDVMTAIGQTDVNAPLSGDALLSKVTEENKRIGMADELRKAGFDSFEQFAQSGMAKDYLTDRRLKDITAKKAEQEIKSLEYGQTAVKNTPLAKIATQFGISGDTPLSEVQKVLPVFQQGQQFDLQNKELATRIKEAEMRNKQFNAQMDYNYKVLGKQLASLDAQTAGTTLFSNTMSRIGELGTILDTPEGKRTDAQRKTLFQLKKDGLRIKPDGTADLSGVYKNATATLFTSPWGGTNQAKAMRDSAKTEYAGAVKMVESLNKIKGLSDSQRTMLTHYQSVIDGGIEGILSSQLFGTGYSSSVNTITPADLMDDKGAVIPSTQNVQTKKTTAPPKKTTAPQGIGYQNPANFNMNQTGQTRVLR